MADNPEVTVLFSSHDLVHTVEVCTRIVALHKGEVVKDIQTSEETLKELEAFFATNAVITFFIAFYNKKSIMK